MYKDVPHLMELELIEPSLYFRTDTESAHRLAHVFLERVDAFI